MDAQVTRIKVGISEKLRNSAETSHILFFNLLWTDAKNDFPIQQALQPYTSPVTQIELVVTIFI